MQNNQVNYQKNQQTEELIVNLSESPSQMSYLYRPMEEDQNEEQSETDDTSIDHNEIEDNNQVLSAKEEISSIAFGANSTSNPLECCSSSPSDSEEDQNQPDFPNIPLQMNYNSTYRANEFPEISDFINSQQIYGIPKDYVYQDLTEYLNSHTSLARENFTRGLRQELKKEIQPKRKQSQMNQGDKQQRSRELIKYENYTVQSVNFTQEGLIVSIKINCFIARYQKEECYIKGNQIMILINKQSKKICVGKTTEDTNKQKKLKNTSIDKQMVVKENEEETEIDHVNDFEIINVQQQIKIKMNVNTNLESFLQDIENIEYKYLLIQPKDYWLSLQQNLECIEKFSNLNEIAFEDQTINGQNGQQEYPQYEFLTDEQKNIKYQQSLNLEIEKQRYYLDEYQFEALNHAFSNKNALIQGPPGTGKTFLANKIIRILCKSYYKYSNKPILVISKKNDSLDQLLTKIRGQDDQIKNKDDQKSSIKILRIGNRSTSEHINELTVESQFGPSQIFKPVHGFQSINRKLQAYISQLKVIKEIKEEFMMLFKKVIRLQENIKIDEKTKYSFYLKWLKNHLTIQSIVDSLKQNKILLDKQQIFDLESSLNKQQNNTEVEMFSNLSPEKKISDYISTIKSFSQFTSGFRKAVLEEFKKFVKINDLIQEMKIYERKYTQNKINSYEDYQSELSEFMSKQQVIGMTMTGFHMNYSAICELKPEIVIVEEASEIIESEFFPILSPFLKHLIQIGDHLQLRPIVKSNTLKNSYNYNSSYFERLIRFNNIELVTLYEQRRMIPEFANFTRLFYGSNYIDSFCTKKRDFVSEISKNGMYMLQHSFPEQVMPDLSFTNAFEAEFIVKLILKLTCDYDPYRITVISMYKPQKILIKSKLNRILIKKQNKDLSLNEINVCTVDQFQGNENDIIILSCVRSNNDDKIGFVANDHRINVAFSRAKQGFFCIGNFYLMSELSETWEKIQNLCEQQMTFGGKYILNEYQKICDQSIKQLQSQMGKNYKDINICNNCSQQSHIGICKYSSLKKLTNNKYQEGFPSLS